MRTYSVTTFGCQMNVHDSERIKGLLESSGLGEAVSSEQADVLVFNTCTIREKADERLVQHLMNARVAKLRDPDKLIVVGGCWSESMKDSLFEEFPFVDFAFGPETSTVWASTSRPAARSRVGISPPSTTLPARFP